jgi:uncharacterized protein YegJ (DUF2314 family)
LPFILLSCKHKKGYIEKDVNGGDEVYNVGGDDEEMNNAIERAKTSYNEFLEAFSNPDSSSNNYSVKLKFAYGENDGEHMWLNDLHYKKDRLFGVLDSDPVNIVWRKFGDTVEVKRDSLSDWMYIEKGRLVGGFTIKALYNKMTEAEKKRFKEEVDFEFEIE